jgi:hypothetical protein
LAFAVYDKLPLKIQGVCVGGGGLWRILTHNSTSEKTAMKRLANVLLADLRSGTAVSDKRNEVSAFLKKHPNGLFLSRSLKFSFANSA